MTKKPSTVRFLAAAEDNTAKARRTARRRLKQYLADPNIPRALKFDAAAEVHQIAVFREVAARKLAETWS